MIVPIRFWLTPFYTGCQWWKQNEIVGALFRHQSIRFRPQAMDNNSKERGGIVCPDDRLVLIQWGQHRGRLVNLYSPVNLLEKETQQRGLLWGMPQLSRQN